MNEQNAPLTGEDAILENLGDAVFTARPDGRLLWVNKAFSRLFGWERDAMVGRHVGKVVPHFAQGGGSGASPAPCNGTGNELTPGHYPWMEAEGVSGERLPVELTLSAFERHGQQYFIGYLRDIRARLLIEDALRYHASHNPLTGLFNSNYLLRDAEKRHTSGQAFTAMVIVLTGVDRICVLYGLDALREALRTVSSRIFHCLSATDMAAHHEGDIFAAITTALNVEEMANHIREEIIRPIRLNNRSFHVMASIGLVRSDDVDSSSEVLFQNGYAAIKSGLANQAEGGIFWFTPEVGQRIQYEDLLETRMRAALTDNRLSLAMQGKVSAVDGRFVGAEALVRWHDDLLGTVPPCDFIPLAERVGCIGAISSWMLTQALSEAAAWQRDGLELTVAVNFSAIDLRNPVLAEEVGAALAATGCKPEKLIIELTESAVAEDPRQAVKQLSALKRLGVSLALDDFGTGYSSLSYLRSFPIDTLKIDRSFIKETPHDADAVAIARTIVALARALGMNTVAEGVETQEQADFLRQLGVDVLQGFLYSPPLPPSQFRLLAGCVPTPH
jgi:PAS domain S-box-containing protein